MGQSEADGMRWMESSPHAEVAWQIKQMCEGVLAIEMPMAPDKTSFRSSEEDAKRDGIVSVVGELRDDKAYAIKLELFRGPANLRVPCGTFIAHLSKLNGKIRVIPSGDAEGGQSSLWVELQIEATPLSLGRSGLIGAELRQLDALAKALRAELPVAFDDGAMLRRYKGLDGTLVPIHPWQCADQAAGAALRSLSEQIQDLLAGSISVALASPFPVVLDFALAVTAAHLQESGGTLGALLAPAFPVRELPGLAAKAPGVVVAPAMRLNFGTNLYEMKNDVFAMLSTLSSIQKPVMFTGSLEQLQSTLSGGQGAAGDPLSPVVLHVPDVPLRALAGYAVRLAGQKVGGLPRRAEGEIADMVIEELGELGHAEQRRLLQVVANRTVSTWGAVRKQPAAAGSFAKRMTEITETLGGLSPRPRAARPPEVQERFTRGLTDPGLLAFFQDQLLAQDEALTQLTARLAMEALTRPPHQPLRYCTQGTPGTGKSESTMLLAERLGVPYVNIDAASMSDPHTASSQLLGSGRGIVGSYQAGRLEQVARHHTGVVVEISDLDHAIPSVRSMMADLFLQMLETGEAQSATGAMFSCSGLIMVFSMNLPDGMDEAVRKKVGFHGAPSRHEIKGKVVSEIKSMLSGAFLSRVGSPILFDPLDGDALGMIVERAIRGAVLSAAERIGWQVGKVRLEKKLGAKAIKAMNGGIVSFGARVILEQGRMLAATAVIDLQRSGTCVAGEDIAVSVTAEGKLVLKMVGQPSTRTRAPRMWED